MFNYFHFVTVDFKFIFVGAVRFQNLESFGSYMVLFGLLPALQFNSLCRLILKLRWNWCRCFSCICRIRVDFWHIDISSLLVANKLVSNMYDYNLMFWKWKCSVLYCRIRCFLTTCYISKRAQRVWSLLTPGCKRSLHKILPASGYIIKGITMTIDIEF